MTTFFPSELPERPQKPSKLGLTRRLTQKLTQKTAKPKKVPVISRPIASDRWVPAIVAPTSPFVTEDVPYVFAHQRTLPTFLESAAEDGRDISRVETNVGSSNLPNPSSFPFRSHTDPVPSLPRQVADLGLAPPAPFSAQIRRKPLPSTLLGGDTTDQLVERFERLRHPPGQSGYGTATVPEEASSGFSLPKSPHHHPNASKEFPWNRKTRHNSAISSPSQRPLTLHRRQNTAPSIGTNAIAIDEESVREDESASKRPSKTFSKTNYFQSRARRRSSQQYRNSMTKPRQQQENRSPSSSSSSSEYETTCSSSNVSYPDLSTQAALAQNTRGRESLQTQLSSPISDRRVLEEQEEQDWQLARRLQQEENEIHNWTQTFFPDGPPYVEHEQQSPRPGSYRISPTLNRNSALHRRGARKTPIYWNSSSDSSSESDEWEEGFSTEKMEVDEINNVSHGTSSLMDIDQSFEKDTEAVKLHEAEEFWNRQEPLGSRECAVCAESFLIKNLPSVPNCDHRPEICADCYAEWITAQLRDSGWKEVKCPGNGCKILLEYHEIQQYATEETFQQYDTFIARAAFSEDPNFRWCRACGSGQIHLSGAQGHNIFTCANCQSKVCIVHENTWHEGETCSEYEYRSSGQKERDQKAQEEASLKAIGKMSKKCPGRNCIYNIEKNNGCDHMTCSKCRYEFCWICLCDYNAVRQKGNSAHKRDCKYHTEQLA